MAYANKAEMQVRYEDQKLIELTDREEPYTDAIVDPVLDVALEDASAIMDDYIGTRYSLPLADVPSSMKRICCVIAFYQLHKGMADDETKQDRDDALRHLQKIAKGAINLIQGGDEPKSSKAEAIVEAPTRTFNRDSLRGI